MTGVGGKSLKRMEMKMVWIERMDWCNGGKGNGFWFLSVGVYSAPIPKSNWTSLPEL